MDFNDLKKRWQHQQTDEEMEYSEQEIFDLINNKMTSFKKGIKKRDRREYIAGAVVVIAFGILFFWVSSFLSKLGCVVIILSAFFITYKLKNAEPERIEEKSFGTHSINKHLKQELENVQQQRNLLKNIVWWYIVPPWIGLFLFTIGTSWYGFIKIIYLALILLMGLGIWYINQRAVSQRFDPLLEEIRDSIEFMETS